MSDNVEISTQQKPLLAAVGIHDPDLIGTGGLAAECDPFPIGRPDRHRVVDLVVSELSESAPVGIGGVDLVVERREGVVTHQGDPSFLAGWSRLGYR